MSADIRTISESVASDRGATKGADNRTLARCVQE